MRLQRPERFYCDGNRMRKLILPLTFIGLLSAILTRARETDARLHQAFLDLRSESVVMNLSAHPDDEDGLTLAYYRMNHGARTYFICFTRGEGGQNEIGPELYEELGVIRTDETLEAAKLLGTRVHFLNLKDFGYSKSATESFRVWGGRKEVLRRLVYHIRRFKPDVIFTNHSTGGGHGHHQVVAISAIAAFDAAADPSMFPEQLELPGITLWQPSKLYSRIFLWNGGVPDVSNPVREVHEPSGRSYVELGAEAVERHKSQGVSGEGLLRFTGGQSMFRLTRANSHYPSDSASFFGGIDLFRDPSVHLLIDIRDRIRSLNEEMSRDALLSEIVNIQQQIMTLREERSALADRIINEWTEELEELARILLGITSSVEMSDSIAVAGQEIVARETIRSENIRVILREATIVTANGWKVLPNGDGVEVPIFTEQRWEAKLRCGDRSVPTLPRTVAQYNPLETDYDITVRFDLELPMGMLRLHERFAPDVALPEEMTIQPRVSWIRGGNDEAVFSYRVQNRNFHKTAGRISADLPVGWETNGSEYVIPDEDGIAEGSIVVFPGEDVSPDDYPIRFLTGHSSVAATVRVFDTHVSPGTRVGIIESYDNTLEWAVGSLGVPFERIDDEDLRSGVLSRFTSIIVDIRAYLVREVLQEKNSRLLEYVRSGGNLIVMYQKVAEWKPDYAPYPFDLTHERITDEEAPVRVLAPGHPLLTSPNMISSTDWHGWVQERGVYFPGDVPEHYVRLISSNDPNEKSLDTGYLVAPYGSGSYIYTSYVWYRQLKERHEGALKCFANMISYPHYREMTGR